VNALEAALVIEAPERDQGGRELDLLLHKSRIDIVPFAQEQVEEAVRGIIDREAQSNGTPGSWVIQVCGIISKQDANRVTLWTS
jgi:hypothetical protein